MADGSITDGAAADVREIRVKSLGADKNAAQASNVIATDDAEKVFQARGAIEPPYDPSKLAGLNEMSSALRQNIDAYCTNIDGFGHRFEPVIDMDSADADLRIAQSIQVERERLRAMRGVPAQVMSIPLTPTPAEVAARKSILIEQMRAEKTRLEQFFNFCSEDMSFVTLRRQTRQDLELTGNGYWEVLRNGAREVSSFVYIPSASMRLMPLDLTHTPATTNHKVSDTDYERVERRKRFRRYVQILENQTVYFKEFGDPREISMRTGAPLLPGAQFEPGDGPATEIIHFRIHSSRSPYGVPRWIGVLLPILGNRQAEEVNYYYFENKSVPPLAILVSGGRLTDQAFKRIQDHIEVELKGKKNFHKILLIEAEGSGGTLSGSGDGSHVRVEIKPLTDAQQKDALFLQYDEKNMDKVGQAFRLPRLLRGDVRDFNRATAEAALDFAEQQVFAPDRNEFDFIINRKVLSDLRIRFWLFRSNAPTVKDPAQLAEVIYKLVMANVLVPAEARELAEGVFNKELRSIDAPWTRQPVPLTLAGVPVIDDATGQAIPGQESLEADDAQKASGPAQPLVTRTAMGYVTTVNEARASNGLGPMTRDDGEPDPRGELMIADYLEQAKAAPRTSASPETDAVVAAALDEADPRSDRGLTIADLQRPEGALALAQGASMRRARFARKGAPARSLATDAKELLALREALLDAEAETAARAFYKAKRKELETSEVPIPAEALEGLLPPELLRN